MLTSDQVRFFHDNGYLIMRGILPQRDIEALRKVVDRLQDDALRKLHQPGYLERAKFLNKDWIEHNDDHYVYREKPDGQFSFHRIERGYTKDPLFAQVAMSPTLLNNAWQIIGRPFWPRAGNVVVKLPHEGAAVRWHQDIPYLYWSSGGHPGRGRPTTHPIPNFTTDIYLESSNSENGCVYAIPGSHRNGTVDVDKLVAAHGFMLPGAVPLEVEPGDVMFHHVAVVHGSPENRSSALRRTFYVHYLADETVRDAYSDWPDLMTAPQNMAFWGQALRARRAPIEREREEPVNFQVTPDGLAPTIT
jgi:hypothetical protein